MSPRFLPDARERLKNELTQAASAADVRQIMARVCDQPPQRLAWRVVARYAPALDRALIERMVVHTGVERVGCSPVDVVMHHPLTASLTQGVFVKTAAFEQMLLDWPDAVSRIGDTLLTSVPWEWAVLSLAWAGRLRAESPLGQRIIALSSDARPASMRLVYALLQAPDLTSETLSTVCQNRYVRQEEWAHVVEAPQANLEFISGRVGDPRFGLNLDFLRFLAYSRNPWKSPGVSEYVLNLLSSRSGENTKAADAFVKRSMEVFEQPPAWPHPGVRLAAFRWLENDTDEALPAWLVDHVSGDDMGWLAVQPLSARARIRLVTTLAGSAAEGEAALSAGLETHKTQNRVRRSR